MKKPLALFDFDRTLYSKDSLIEFTRSCFGDFRFFLGMVRISPYLIGMKIGLLRNSDVKQQYFAHFFGGMTASDFHSKASSFALSQIDSNLDPNVFSKFKNHLDAGHEVVIVTASMPDWIQPWSARYGVEVIGTNPEVIGGLLSGRFATENCYGVEKTNRIFTKVKIDEYESVYVYGKGKGDLEMLTLRRNCQSFS